MFITHLVKANYTLSFFSHDFNSDEISYYLYLRLGLSESRINKIFSNKDVSDNKETISQSCLEELGDFIEISFYETIQCSNISIPIPEHRQY